MQSAWLGYGRDHEQFWKLTPREIHAILGGDNERLRSEHELARQRNYELSGLIAYAFHDPKSLPKYSDASEQKKPETVPDEVAQARVRGYFIALAGGKPKARAS